MEDYGRKRQRRLAHAPSDFRPKAVESRFGERHGRKALASRQESQERRGWKHRFRKHHSIERQDIGERKQNSCRNGIHPETQGSQGRKEGRSQARSQKEEVILRKAYFFFSSLKTSFCACELIITPAPSSTPAQTLLRG